jgi:hypothetical protein
MLRKIFITLKSSIPDEIALIRKKTSEKTIPLQIIIIYNKEDLPNQNQGVGSKFCR